MQMQKKNADPSRGRDLLRRNDRKRTSSYATQVFWILLAALTLYLSYELYRDIIQATISSFDTFTPALATFYLVGFGMSVLVRSNRRWVWWPVLLYTLGLLALGTFYYNPNILLARHPGLIDWFESVAYLGLLSIAAFLCIQHLRGNMLIPQEPADS